MLRRRLTFPAAAIALVLSFFLTGLGIWAGNVIVSAMSDQLVQQWTEAVRRDVNVMITTGDSMSTRMVNDIGRHDVPLGDPAALGRELYGLLRDEPNVQWLACSNEAGGVIDAGRLADGTLVFLMTDGFRAGMFREYEATPDGRMGNLRKSGVYLDARQKPWYTRARDTRAKGWSEPFLGSAEFVLGVALSAPVFNKDGGFTGVCNVVLILTALTDFMKSTRLGDNGRAFIIDTTGQLIAASGRVAPVVTGNDGKEARLLASEAADPIVRETARHLARHPEIIAPSSTGPRAFSFDDPEQGRIYAAVDRFEAPGEIAWTIISALPASDFLGPVYRAAYLSIAVGTAIVAVFVILGLWVGGRTLRPLTALTQAAQAIAKGEWRDVPEVQRNDEVGVLAQSFTLMTARLKETLDGLRRSEARLEEAQRLTHVGYWERDFDTDHITWSDETLRIFGLAPQQPAITFAELQELIHPEDRGMVTEAMAEALRGGPRYDVEYRVVRPDGELRIAHSQGDVTRDESGRPHRIFGTIQDVTERKQAVEALRKAQTELAHVNRVATMGQLTASIAHEILQPIGAARNYARAALNFLDQQPPDLREVKEALGRIVGAADRSGEIIERIRDNIKKAPPRRDRIDLNKAINEVIVLARSELTKNGVSVQTRLTEGLFPVKGDRVQVQQVVMNLILNAVEAMSSVEAGARELLISTEQSQTDGVLVAVRDSGPGIDPGRLERVFEAFYTTKSGGMGLSICRSIIEAHGGRMWVTANEPRGAVFRFTLPLSRDEPAPAEHFGEMPAA
jgi:PAS domain S-box-containing protein